MPNGTDIFTQKGMEHRGFMKNQLDIAREGKIKAGTHTESIKWRGERLEHFLPWLAHVPTPAIARLISTQEDGNSEV